MNCIIIEDQPPAQRILKKYIADVHFLKLIGVFPDAIQALDCIKANEVDLIFLDIHLPKLSGIDFLKSFNQSAEIILTTAFPDYALESYEYDVVDYLLKPFSFQRFVKALSKLNGRNSGPKQSHLGSSPKAQLKSEIFIKTGHEHVKIALQEILFIKSDADYTEIHLSDKKYLSSETLRYWHHTLNPQKFTRVHKSFIVNTSFIEKVVGNQIYLTNQNRIPIGRAFKEAFQKNFLL